MTLTREQIAGLRELLAKVADMLRTHAADLVGEFSDYGQAAEVYAAAIELESGGAALLDIAEAVELTAKKRWGAQ